MLLCCQLALLKWEEMMLPSEMEIILAIALNRSVGKKLANSSMDVISEYFINVFNSLVRRGYLKGNRVKGYQLTPMGKTTLIRLLQENEARTQNALRRIKILGVDYHTRMDKLRKEQSRSSREAKESLLTLLAK